MLHFQKLRFKHKEVTDFYQSPAKMAPSGLKAVVGESKYQIP